jgi:hypothetical protein
MRDEEKRKIEKARSVKGIGTGALPAWAGIH